MSSKEKGRPAGGTPIPTSIRQDVSEFKQQPLQLQVSRLVHRCALSADAAAILAPLVFGEAVQ
jgi:hypothetical protein